MVVATIGERAETFVVDHLAVFHHHDLAPWIGPIADARPGNRVQTASITFRDVAFWKLNGRLVCNHLTNRWQGLYGDFLCRQNVRLFFGSTHHDAVATLEFAHRNRQSAMGFHLTRKQLHHRVDGGHLVLIGHHQALHAIVDAEHIQGIRASKKIENHVVLCHQAVEELHGLVVDAVVLVSKHRGFLDADHHQVESLQLLQPIRRFRGDGVFGHHKRGGHVAACPQAVVHVVFRVAYGHHGDFLVVDQRNHLVFIAKHRDGLVIERLAQIGVFLLFQVG